MCGIAGILNFTGQAVLRPTMERMTESLRHRGPDDAGIFLEGDVSLGHRRLSILDVSSCGHQPMSNEDGSIWISFNGEIYNFQSLRSDLLARGHVFRSRSDTEVLIHLYEERGTSMLDALNGIFAFAIWDRPRRRLFLARDRLGVKPLFYAKTPSAFLFGSEIKAILAADVLDRRVYLPALHHYLSLNYLPAPLTLFEGIYQLRPAEWVVVENGFVQIQRYWKLPAETIEISGHDAAARLDAHLDRATRAQVISDVPVGAFLSGGLDSSALVYYLKNVLGRTQTFSIGFRESSYDETSHARTVAAALGTEHHEQIVTTEARQVLESIIHHAEEPTADASMIAVWYLSRLARQHVTVALSGDGADEILAGYETYQANQLAAFYRRLPRWVRGSFIEPLVRLWPVQDRKLSWEYKLKRFIAAAHLSPEQAHFSWRIIFDESHKRLLWKPEVRGALQAHDTFEFVREYFRRGADLNAFLAFDTEFYLPNDMLTKVDRMSMAHGLEVRVPYLDHELVEFVARLPAHLKLRRFFRKKYLLKRIMRQRLPAEILARPKAGFNMPLNRWFKTDLREYVRDMLSRETVARLGFFEPSEVERLLDEHDRGIADWSYQIYGLLVFRLWYKCFIESRR